MKLTERERNQIESAGRQAGIGREGAFTCPYFGDEHEHRFSAWLEGYQRGAEEVRYPNMSNFSK
jgi:ribosome modulation factor